MKKRRPPPSPSPHGPLADGSAAGASVPFPQGSGTPDGQARRDLDRLIPGFVHQLRSPLAAAASTAALLLEGRALSADQRAALELILRSAERARRAVQNLLAYAKGETPPWTHGSVNAPMNAAIDYLEGICRAKAIRIEKRQAAGLPEVWLQPELLQEALLNYAVNSIEAMPAGGTLSLETSARDGNVLAVIRDTGVGMDLRSFKPGRFKTTKPGGMGLGLAFSAEILRQHGATLSIGSVPGRGTVVTLAFPIPPQDAAHGLA